VDGCEILHQLIEIKHPLLKKKSTIQNWWFIGFLNHPQYHPQRDTAKGTLELIPKNQKGFLEMKKNMDLLLIEKIWIQGKYAGWWFGTFGLFFHILGMSSSQLTKSYFSEG
jgi:hypothetical protein